MTKLEVGQQWYNTLHANQPVDIIDLTELVVMVKTYSGFIYTYDYKQFLAEYTQEAQLGNLTR